MITIDGSTLEGGGQLVRVALSLSSIYNIPVRITNIRANRTSQRNGSGRGRGGHHFGHDAGSSRSWNADVGMARSNYKGQPKRHQSGPRSGGGLKESHLAAVLWLAERCDAIVDGAAVGETELVFRPRKVKGGSQADLQQALSLDTSCIELKKPGSIWLVWQAIFPLIVFGPGRGSTGSIQAKGVIQDSDGDKGIDNINPASRITLRGGTNVPKSPSTEYVQQVFVPLCERIGLPRVNIKVKERGWAGSAPQIGEVEIEVETSASSKVRQPFSLKEFHLHDRGFITKIHMTIVAGSEQTFGLVETQLRESLHRFNSTCEAFPADTSIIMHHDSTAMSGDERRLYVLLVAETSSGFRIGRDCLGSGRQMTNEADRRNIVAGVVGTVTRDFMAECLHGGCLDEFAQDQMVIFQALADGQSSIEMGHGGRKGWRDATMTRRSVQGEMTGQGESLHTRTVKWVCQEMLGRVLEEDCEGQALGSQAECGMEHLGDVLID